MPSNGGTLGRGAGCHHQQRADTDRRGLCRQPQARSTASAADCRRAPGTGDLHTGQGDSGPDRVGVRARRGPPGQVPQPQGEHVGAVAGGGPPDRRRSHRQRPGHQRSLLTRKFAAERLESRVRGESAFDAFASGDGRDGLRPSWPEPSSPEPALLPRLVAALRAGTFFTTFLTAAFLAGAFFTTFLTAACLAGAFFTTFLAAAFLAGAFFTTFLAAAFLAGAFFAAFLAPPLATTPRFTAGPSAGSRCEPETTALNCAPGRKAGTEVGLTFTVSPVRGLRATRAARRRCSKTPNPVMVTLSPLCTARTIVSTTFSTAAVACRRSEPNLSVSTSMSSALFMQILRS